MRDDLSNSERDLFRKLQRTIKDAGSSVTRLLLYHLLDLQLEALREKYRIAVARRETLKADALKPVGADLGRANQRLQERVDGVLAALDAIDDPDVEPDLGALGTALLATEDAARSVTTTLNHATRIADPATWAELARAPVTTPPARPKPPAPKPAPPPVEAPSSPVTSKRRAVIGRSTTPTLFDGGQDGDRTREGEG